MALTPFEFTSRKSPLVARRKAFKFVNIKDRPIKAHDLNVFLVDVATGNDYLIYNGQDPTTEVMKNLNLECLLYDEMGYDYQSWTLLKDAEENPYRIIEKPLGLSIPNPKKCNKSFHNVGD